MMAAPLSQGLAQPAPAVLRELALAFCHCMRADRASPIVAPDDCDLFVDMFTSVYVAPSAEQIAARWPGERQLFALAHGLAVVVLQASQGALDAVGRDPRAEARAQIKDAIEHREAARLVPALVAADQYRHAPQRATFLGVQRHPMVPGFEAACWFIWNARHRYALLRPPPPQPTFENWPADVAAVDSWAMASLRAILDSDALPRKAVPLFRREFARHLCRLDTELAIRIKFERSPRDDEAHWSGIFFTRLYRFAGDLVLASLDAHRLSEHRASITAHLRNLSLAQISDDLVRCQPRIFL